MDPKSNTKHALFQLRLKLCTCDPAMRSASLYPTDRPDMSAVKVVVAVTEYVWWL